MRLSPFVRHAYTSIIPPKARRRLERSLLRPYPGEYDRDKYIFIHIPKTAGKSIAHRLHNRGAVHLTYAEYERILGERIQDYFVFAVVREPLDRLTSTYAYLRQGGNRSREDVRFAEKYVRDRSLQAFIDECLTNPAVSRSPFLLPQHEFLRRSDGELAEIALLRFERLERDFAAIAHRLGVGQNLPVINKSDRSRIDASLSPETLRTVALHYREDYQVLQYEAPLLGDTGVASECRKWHG
jgi:chondroitin 4-sulfotransferase 11